MDKEIEKKLLSFDYEERKAGLYLLKKKIEEGDIKKINIKPYLNLHIHSFHSFNYKNWSPSRIVFEAWINNLEYVGVVDFDTIIAIEETLLSGEILNTKVVSGFESRVFLPELKDKVINSPEEPGIYYLCGKGFKKAIDDNSEEGKFFNKLKEIAQKRNKKVIEKLNNFLVDIKIDYEKDLLPLTPSNNPTERHIIFAYIRKSEEIFGEKVDDFWAGILKIDKKNIGILRKEKQHDFQEILRKKLIKFGGPGYIKPEVENFPLFDEVVKMTEKVGGIPIGTWLDGTNPGEENPENLIGLMKNKKIKGITIIPERNWNIKNSDERKIKTEKLIDFLETCKKMEMPVICGTEMNKFEQPFIDDFSQPILSKYLPYFMESALSLFS